MLLAVLVLSNTPTGFLHKIFANHSDFVNNAISDSNKPQLNTTGINCHCDHLVVIAPYTSAPAVLTVTILPSFAEYNIDRRANALFSQPLLFKLRGPPLLIV